MGINAILGKERIKLYDHRALLLNVFVVIKLYRVK